MPGIIINIDPVIFRLGAFELRWYSLAIITAVIAAIAIAVRQAKKKGIAEEQTYSLAMWAIIGGIIGARLFHVIDQFEFYAQNPAHIFQFQQGGLAIWGAMAGGSIAAVLYARMKHVPLAPLFDAATPALLTAQIIGRFGCIVNGDAYGSITNLSWGFIYVHPNALIPANLAGLPTHPYPVYEMLWNAMILVGVLRFGPRFQKDGMIFLSYISCYSVGRFLLTFVRQERIIFADFQQAQIIALATFMVSTAALIYLMTKRPSLKGGNENVQ